MGCCLWGVSYPIIVYLGGTRRWTGGEQRQSAEDEVEEVLEISGADSTGIQELWTRLWSVTPYRPIPSYLVPPPKAEQLATAQLYIWDRYDAYIYLELLLSDMSALIPMI